jgi:probable phosphoglycerate mutase
MYSAMAVPMGNLPATSPNARIGVVARLREVEGDVAVFSHAHFLRVLTARWMQLDPLAALGFVVHPAAIGLLGYEHGSREEPILVRWNEECGGPLWR